MTKGEISDILFEDAKRGAIESRKLKEIEEECDFTTAMFSIIERMKRLADKYQALLAAYLSGDGWEEEKKP
jgi:hypothetical protein